MIQVADDYGVLPAENALLKPILFPLRNVRTADISRWFDECELAGLIARYDGPDNKRYAVIRNFDQRLTFKRHVYPAPAQNLFEDEPNCNAASPVPLQKNRAAEIADRVYRAYPKKMGMLAGMKAAVAAVNAKHDRGMSYDEIETELLQAVKLYSEATAKWNFRRKKFIWSMRTFFEDGHYADDPECWQDYDDSQQTTSPSAAGYVVTMTGERVRRSVLP